MSLWDEFQINLLAYAITAGVGVLLVVPIFFSSGRLLPTPSVPSGTWTGPEVVLVFCWLLCVPSISRVLLEFLGFFEAIFEQPPGSVRKDIWATPLTILLTLVGFGGLLAISRARPSQLGITTARWPQNTFLGYVGFLVLTPLVLGLYFLVLLLLAQWNIAPESHPLEDLSKIPLWPGEWGLLFFRATISAALLEELAFRGVLQDWLRRASLADHAAMIGVTLLLALTLFWHGWTAFFFAVLMALGYGAGVFLESVRSGRDSGYLAIFGSAMLFSVFHFQVWPHPIPLFYLGLGLGFLALRTQSLLPCIVLHGLFNTVACVVMVLNQLG